MDLAELGKLNPHMRYVTVKGFAAHIMRNLSRALLAPGETTFEVSSFRSWRSNSSLSKRNPPGNQSTSGD